MSQPRMFVVVLVLVAGGLGGDCCGLVYRGHADDSSQLKGALHLSEWVAANGLVSQNKGKRADGTVLVIEADGKCPSTATEAELAKRRGPRRSVRSCCQWHIGKTKRKQQGPKLRRRKSKNGKEAMVIVMYALRRGADGLLHGPINKVNQQEGVGRFCGPAGRRGLGACGGDAPRLSTESETGRSGADRRRQRAGAKPAGGVCRLKPPSG